VRADKPAYTTQGYDDVADDIASAWECIRLLLKTPPPRATAILDYVRAWNSRRPAPSAADDPTEEQA
jgi:hypothetical protein